MLRIRGIRLLYDKNEDEDRRRQKLLKKAASILGIRSGDIKAHFIVRRSVDARKKPRLFLEYTLDVSCGHEDKALARCRDGSVSRAEDPLWKAPAVLGERKRIVVAGAGPAGLFAAYTLALCGFSPLVLERGRDVDSRLADVERFWRTGELDETSNVQFGEGGAGTFSDGKLNSRIKDPSGRILFVLKTLVSFGAGEDILWDSHPHIGTDVLRLVVKNLRQRIIGLGGEVRFESPLTDIISDKGHLTDIVVMAGEELHCDALVLAPGHSARDTMEMLRSRSLAMEFKDFAAGYRIIHPQGMVDLCQYGMEDPGSLGAAPYSLTAKVSDGRGVYSFCMCPGGFVVNASSEQGRLCVNGMSYSGRDGRFANSAIVMTAGYEDCINELSAAGRPVEAGDPLAGMYFQRLMEERAYEAAGGRIPVQRYMGGFADCSMRVQAGIGGFADGGARALDIGAIAAEAFKGQCDAASLRGILPRVMEDAFEEGMASFERKMEGFAFEGIMAGMESRTSSPVRLLRDEAGEASIKGIFPCGEGAGYAGGIVSAAVDGIKTAEKVAMKYGSQGQFKG